MKCSAWFLAVFFAILSAAISSQAQTTKGAVVFEQHCASCHGNANAATPAPDVMSLWKMTAEAVYAALGKAPHTSLTGVTDSDLREVASYLGRRDVDVAKITDAKLMPNQCPGNSPIGDLSAKPLWNAAYGGMAFPTRASSLRRVQA